MPAAAAAIGAATPARRVVAVIGAAMPARPEAAATGAATPARAARIIPAQTIRTGAAGVATGAAATTARRADRITHSNPPHEPGEGRTRDSWHYTSTVA